MTANKLSTGRSLAAGTGAAMLALTSVSAGQVLTLDGEVPAGEPDHFRVAFEVPEGIAEIEITHDDLSDENILDWGLEDPNGVRGWGGGNDEPAIVGELASSRSYYVGPVSAGTWNVLVGKAKINETPAMYAITVTLRDTPTLAPQTERAPYAPSPPLSTEARWYVGDFHVHSNESGDASATLDAIGDLAAERGLDFVVITDHNTTSQADYLVDAQGRHPDVLFIPGIEVTTYDGHAGAIGATSFVEHKIGLDGATIDDAVSEVLAQGALFSVHHPAFELGDLCIGCAWNHGVDLERIDAVEIGTAGSYGVFLKETKAFWEGVLDQGHHAAALGGSDDHRAGIDLGVFDAPIGSPATYVFATELSAAAIMEGVSAGRTVVKLEGPEAPMVEFATDPPLDGDTAAGSQILLTATITGASGGELVWIQDGESVEGSPLPIDDDPFVQELLVTPPGSESTRVRAEIGFSGSTKTITSHVWLIDGPGGPDVEDPSVDGGSTDDGCGCRAVGDAGRKGRGGLLAIGTVLALAVARSRRRSA